MQPPTEIRSSDEKWKDAGQWARKATFAVWLSGLASVGLTWVQSRWYVFHPHYLPLLFLFLVLAVSTFLAVACCLWRIVRGPRRARATILAVVALLPAGFWANVGIVAKTNWERRLVPNTLTMRLSKAMGAAFIHAEADFEYRNRLETDRLVMYYGHLDHPEHDLAEMDRHLARLENLLGGTISAKAHWIRGSLPRTGVGSLSVHGLSLGSDSSPEILGQDIGHYRGDRHELAHAALDWFRLPSSDPPQVLNEGWAIAQCGDTTLELAQAAANARQVGVRELLGPDWYYRASGPVYSVGGAFVDFLIRKHGAESFRRFYTECQLDKVEAKCLEIFGADLDAIEVEFWEDVNESLSTSAIAPP